MARRLLLTLLALVAAACAGNRPPPVTPPPGPAWTLGVAVTVAGEGTPIEHAKVEIREGPASGQIATTGADGGTFFPLLPQAVYSLCANAEGFAERCLGVDLNRQQNVGIDLERMQQPPPPVEPVAGGIVGQLRIEVGGGFVDDRGPWLPLLWHTGDFPSRWSRGQQAAVSADLDDIKRAGWDGVRVWLTLGGDSDFWRGRGIGPTITPDYWAHIQAFLEACKARGLVVHAALGDIRPSIVPDRVGYALQLADIVQAVGPSTIALFEGANESRDTGEPDPARLAAFVLHFKQRLPGVLVGLSAFTGTEDVGILDRFSRPPADLFLVHGFRDNRWWDRIRHIFSLRYEGKPAKRIGWQGEPFGFGVLVSASQNKHENDDDVMTGAAAMALMTRQAWVGFSGPGVISDCAAGERIANYVCNGERMQDMPGFWSTPKVRSMLPADVMRYDELFHGGETWRHKRVFVASGENRADHAYYRDGRFVCVIYGEHIDAVQPQPGVEFETYSDHRLGNKVRIVVGKVIRRHTAVMPAATSLPWAA